MHSLQVHTSHNPHTFPCCFVLQVRDMITKAGTFKASGSEALFQLPEAHAAFMVPSSAASLRAGFDAAYASLRGAKGGSTSLTGTSMRYAF